MGEHVTVVEFLINDHEVQVSDTKEILPMSAAHSKEVGGLHLAKADREYLLNTLMPQQIKAFSETVTRYGPRAGTTNMEVISVERAENYGDMPIDDRYVTPGPIRADNGDEKVRYIIKWRDNSAPAP